MAKRRQTAKPATNSGTEQEARLLMNQGKQPALIVNKDSSNENLTASSTGDNHEEDYGPKISDPSTQRVEGKWQKKLTSEEVKKKFLKIV